MAFCKGIPQLNKIKEYSPLLMISMFLLAIISVFSGWLFYDFFVGNNWESFWKDSLFVLPTSDGLMDLNLSAFLDTIAANLINYNRNWYSYIIVFNYSKSTKYIN